MCRSMQIALLMCFVPHQSSEIFIASTMQISHLFFNELWCLWVIKHIHCTFQRNTIHLTQISNNFSAFATHLRLALIVNDNLMLLIKVTQSLSILSEQKQYWILGFSYFRTPRVCSFDNSPAKYRSIVMITRSFAIPPMIRSYFSTGLPILQAAT